MLEQWELIVYYSFQHYNFFYMIYHLVSKSKWLEDEVLVFLGYIADKECYFEEISIVDLAFEFSSFQVQRITWNLERQYHWTYLQGSDGDTDIENGLWTQWRKERVGWTERAAWKHIYYHT